ncbi:hypothetical protein M9H77_35982 [Catharanthus roseus]|uniref:Uncharacterized protein n=1 Tax=Catharanthus roseus TaxID=4058 RepID=A0ACB9ZSQ5_CATRO|nr:hypothetical protein M9H77_35982 [Catharanthus roseus]
MVLPGGRREDDDLCLVTDRTRRVEGRTITASSQGLRSRHSTSDIPSTPTLFATGLYYNTGAPSSSTQPPHIPIRSCPLLQSHRTHTLVPYDIYGSSHPPSQPPPALYDPYVHAPSVRPHIPYRSKVQETLKVFSGPGRKLGADFFDQPVGGVPLDSLVHDHDNDDDDNDDDDARDDEEPVYVAPVAPAFSSSRSRNKRPDKARELTGPADGGPIDPELIPSYGEHMERGMLKSRSRYITLTGWTLTDLERLNWWQGQDLCICGLLFDATTDTRRRLSSCDRAACYIQYLLGSSLFTDKSGNVVPAKLWPLVKDFRSYRGLLGVLRRLPTYTGTLVRPRVLMRRSWLDVGCCLIYY